MISSSIVRGIQVTVIYVSTSLLFCGCISLFSADAFVSRPHGDVFLRKSSLNLPPSSLLLGIRPLRQPSSASVLLLLFSSSPTASSETVTNDRKQDSLIVEPPPSLLPLNATSTEEEEEEALASMQSSFDWDKQWYPVLPLTSLENFEKPIVSITMLNRPLVVWKNSQGKYVVFDDRCPHRRAPLSTGRVVGNDGDGSCRLQCRYHGWEFNASGVCTKIPMLSAAATTNQHDYDDSATTTSDNKSNKFRVPTYPSQQAGGLLWVFMDPTVTSPPPIPPMALLEKKKDNEDSVLSFSCDIQPVSFRSMIENSFGKSQCPTLK
jgi:nitrite reductase/ring-hydroxylating ferredoxin subunit